jgi:hypothetical protein
VVSETDGAPGSLSDSTPVAAAVSLTSMASLPRTNYHAASPPHVSFAIATPRGLDATLSSAVAAAHGARAKATCE